MRVHISAPRAGPAAGGGAAAKAFITGRAHALGFELARVVSADDVPDDIGDRLAQFVALGRHGTMGWMADTLERRRHPKRLWQGVRSIIVLGMNYGPERDPMADLSDPNVGVVSVYARGRDYHDVIKGRLKQLGGQVVAAHGGDLKVFVDTAPVMEKPLAARAGIGWQGKHTNVVSREFGSWLFLGALFTSLALPPDAPESDHCGGCRRCLEVCPTDAFPAPYQLDARRCISYLTIEHPGSIPRRLRSRLGNRIYGCDDCLAVCPWNKFARAAKEAKLAGPVDARAPDLAQLAALDDRAFRRRFAGTPVKRTGRDRFVRNVMIAIGNARDRHFLPLIERRLEDGAPIVRAAAVWAAGRTCAPEQRNRLRERLQPCERDPLVMKEWHAIDDAEHD